MFSEGGHERVGGAARPITLHGAVILHRPYATVQSFDDGLEELVAAMCAAADNADGDAFAAYSADGASYRFGNNEPLTGPAAIVAATNGIVDAVWPVRHQIDQVAAVGSQLFCRFTIHVSPPDGIGLALPCVTVIELDDRDRITDYRVHMDIAPALRP